jgi:hypothetical protein
MNGEFIGRHVRMPRNDNQAAMPRQNTTTLISGTRGVKNGVKGCPKQHHVTVSRFFLACAVKCHEICCLPPIRSLFHHFCRPKISQAQNGFPRLTRPVFRRWLPVQHIAWTASTTNTDDLPPYSPLPHWSMPIGHTTFSQLSEPTPGSSSTCTLLFPISNSFLGSILQSSPTQAGCRRYSPSNAALPFLGKNR